MESRGNIYQTLILAAQSHLEEKGYIPEDLDDFAARCSLAADEILAVFPSTSDLREGLIYQAVTLLNDALRDGVIHAASDDPLVQLRAIGHAYLKWAEANPALFRMLVTALNGPIEPDSTLHRYTSSMRDLYHRKLAEAQNRGLISSARNIEVVTMMLHCLVKGGNMMFLTRDTDPWYQGETRSTRDLAESIFQEFLDSISAKPAAAG